MRIATQHAWLDLGAWITKTADDKIPLTKMWHLVYLVTYGWTDRLKRLRKELKTLLARADLPATVREVLKALARLVKKREKKDEQIAVFRVDD